MSHRSVIFLSVVALGAGFACSAWDLVSYRLVLGLTATAVLLIGSLRSLHLSPFVKGEDESDNQSITLGDAMRMPVVASVALVAVYTVVRRVQSTVLQSVCRGYFAALGALCLKIYVKEALGPVWAVTLPKGQYKGTHGLPWSKKTALIVFEWSDVVSYAVAAGVALAYYFAKHWALNNLIALAFCAWGIENTSLSNFKVGAILLLEAAVLDGIWVFATDLFNTLAVELDAPVKLLFPKAAGGDEFALLGLGDIILPGIFLGLAYRLDYFLCCKKEVKGAPKHFLFGVCAYVLGLCLSLLATAYFASGQPALVLLGGCVVVGVYLGSLLTGAVRDLGNYKEE